LLGSARPQQISIDGRYLLENLPPPLIDPDSVTHRGEHLAWERDLLGASAAMGHTEINGRVQFTRSTAALRFATPDAAFDDAAPQDFVKRRELRQQPLASFQQGIHSYGSITVRYFRRKLLP